MTLILKRTMTKKDLTNSLFIFSLYEKFEPYQTFHSNFT